MEYKLFINTRFVKISFAFRRVRTFLGGMTIFTTKITCVFRTVYDIMNTYLFAFITNIILGRVHGPGFVRTIFKPVTSFITFFAHISRR